MENGGARRTLLTGASSGIGAALARILGARGCELWLAARRGHELEALAAEIARSGGRAHPVILDVTDADRTAQAVVELDERCGGFDLVVANAGIGATEPVARMTWPLARDILMTNLVGAAATIVPLLPRMVARRRGHVVGISSQSADIATPGSPPYAASKAGLTHLLLSARTELSAAGVDVTVVHPGFVRTAMTTSNRFRMPFLLEADAAAAIIADAIDRRVPLLRFPRRLALLIRAFNLLPRSMRERILLRTAKFD